MISIIIVLSYVCTVPVARIDMLNASLWSRVSFDALQEPAELLADATLMEELEKSYDGDESGGMAEFWLRATVPLEEVVERAIVREVGDGLSKLSGRNWFKTFRRRMTVEETNTDSGRREIKQ